VWWDGDLLRELLDGNCISKWNWAAGEEVTIFQADDCTSNNGTKSTPALSRTSWGDWREEVIWRTRDNTELRLYMDHDPTEHRFVTLMHDPQYRLAVDLAERGLQPAAASGLLSRRGMKPPPWPSINTRLQNRPPGFDGPRNGVSRRS